MKIERRTILKAPSWSLGEVTARPTSSEPGDIEIQHENVLVLPVVGLFSKHDRPGRRAIITANHAGFIAAGQPYRIGYPGAIGDRCLTLRFAQDALERFVGNADDPALVPSALLSPSTIIARNMLWRRLHGGQWEPLEVEELSENLLASALDVLRATATRTRIRRRQRLQAVETVSEVIARRPARKWRLSDLASSANVSPFHLCRMFRAQTGTSIYGYVLRARLGVALDLLLDTDDGLAKVAADTGFASHSHFTARFRAAFGMTPAAFRRGAKAGILRK